MIAPKGPRFLLPLWQHPGPPKPPLLGSVHRPTAGITASSELKAREGLQGKDSLTASYFSVPCCLSPQGSPRNWTLPLQVGWGHLSPCPQSQSLSLNPSDATLCSHLPVSQLLMEQTPAAVPYVGADSFQPGPAEEEARTQKRPGHLGRQGLLFSIRLVFWLRGPLSASALNAVHAALGLHVKGASSATVDLHFSSKAHVHGKF